MSANVPPRLLEERDRLARLRAAIAVGDAQIARGEGIPYTPELLAELDREVDERVRTGGRSKPSVGPETLVHLRDRDDVRRGLQVGLAA